MPSPNPVITSVGGTNTFTRYAGSAGGGSIICSGPGILKSVFVFSRLQSGFPTNIVDFGGTFVSGLATFAAASGMNIIGRVPDTYDTAVNAGGTVTTPVDAFIATQPLNFDSPFYSGLAFSDRSGSNPFTLTYLCGRVQQA
jgi:hypothetical protein